MTNDFGAETVAQWFHEAYERLAPDFGYETRKDSAVPWADVPEPNRSLMIAVAAAVLQKVDIALNLPVGVALADTRMNVHGDRLVARTLREDNWQSRP
jgi:hypothetical protein